MQGRLCATGTVSLVMVMSLGRFIRRDDAGSRRGRGLWPMWSAAFSGDQAISSAEWFERLRGSPAFAAFLRQRLRPKAPFVLDEEEACVEAQGHELSVFRRYLIDNYFFPTYRLTDSALAVVNPTLLADPSVAEQLRAWTFKLRLTRNGMAVVKLERTLSQVPFSAISELVLETQRFVPAAGPPDDGRVLTQWQLAMDVVALFVRACDYTFVVPGVEGNGHDTVILRLHGDYQSSRIPLHDRHIVYLFSTITVDGQPVDRAELTSRYDHEVVGLLESSLVFGRGAPVYPAYKPAIVDEIFRADTSTWQDELCLQTPEATMIWYPSTLDSAPVVGRDISSARRDTYEDYWRSIARGIEHIVALKNELQLIERATTQLLEQVPGITRRATDGNLNKADRQAISNLANGIATLFSSLPQQRDLLVPSSVFRRSAAYRKFHRLMELLGIYEIEEHIQTNVEELNAFLAHFNSIQIQSDTQRTNLRFAWLTLILSLMIIPSCMADMIQVRHNWNQLDDLSAPLGQLLVAAAAALGAIPAVSLAAGALVALALVAALALILRVRRRRPR